MSILDYLIMIVPTLFVFYMGWYTRRYIRGVVDFLSAGRLCGRYVISVASVASALSIIGMVAYVEVHYKTGFALTFWRSILLPVTVMMGLTGFFFYRFRETKAMSIGQFLEMRYSRGLRIFAAALRSISEMLANMIMPAIAARFFIYFLDLPNSFQFCGLTFSTFHLLILVGLILAIGIICMSGMLGIVVTDSLQGLLLYPLLVFFIIFLLYKFSWNTEIAQVMVDRVPGESFLNPFDMSSLRDFNFFALGVAIFSAFLHRGSWATGSSSNARSPHEQKMAGLLGDWRGALNMLFYVLLAVSILTIMNHIHYANDAKAIRTKICSKIANEIIAEPQIRDSVIKVTEAIPAHTHRVGIDAPLAEKSNLDTPYLNAAHAELQKGEKGHASFQQFRTLYHQMMLAVSMRHMLPPGVLGLFCLLMILAMISTDDSRIYSAAGTISQDVILPLLKRPLSPERHMQMIRWVSIGIGVVFFLGSSYMAQLDYIQLFVNLMTTMWLGGCGPVLLFGLYSRFGNKWGAWTSLLMGMFMGFSGILLQRNWASSIYPFLQEHQLVDTVGNLLTAISRPLNPLVVWEMNPVKFPINSYEIYLMTMLLTLSLYVLVSYLTGRGKEKFNLERMLHRGIYAIKGEKQPQHIKWTFCNVLNKLVGINAEYTTGDKWIAWLLFVYSFIYKFGFIFLAVVAFNLVSPWKAQAWVTYFLITSLVIPGILAVITTFWFGVGGIRDMIQLFRDLKARTTVNSLDDGRVEGNISLADKQELEAVESNRKDKN